MDLCDRTDGCVGVEMHTTLPRCFLNMHNCWEDKPADFAPSGDQTADWQHPPALGLAENYHFLVQKQDDLVLREYGKVPGRFCAGRNAPATDLPAIMHHERCSVKCPSNSDAEGCEGYSTSDNPASSKPAFEKKH